ncbi:MAG: patatin-like phospholipase family protein [Acidobacteriota bacterium]
MPDLDKTQATEESGPSTESHASEKAPKVAIALTGGGARGAYQVGVLRGIARHLPELRFPIITGASAGAINAIYLAAHPGSPQEATADLSRVWGDIRFEDVFRVDFGCLMRRSLLWLAKLGLGLGHLGVRVHGLLDTSPLRDLLSRELGSCNEIGPQGEVLGIDRNLKNQRLEALALMTVNYATGQTVSWVQGRETARWERPARRSQHTKVTVEHVMASAALPLMFPAVQLGNAWYGDGSIRMAAPLSPALHLGADHILAISTQYPRSQAEANKPSFESYPSPAQIAGNLLNAIFLDVLDQDVQRLERLNGLLEKLPPEERDGLKPVDIVVMRPSEDLGRLSARYEPRLPWSFRFMTRNLGTHQTESPDSLSLLMFQPDYVRRLMEVGERDAETQIDAIRRLAGAPVQPAPAEGRTASSPTP